MDFKRLSELIRDEAWNFSSISDYHYFSLTNSLTIQIYYYEKIMYFTVFKKNALKSSQACFYTRNMRNKSNSDVETFINSLRTSKSKERENIIKFIKSNICTRNESWVRAHGM